LPAQAFRQRLSAGYLAPFIAMSLLAVVVLWRIDMQISTSKWVEHSDQVLIGAKDAELDLRAMQLALRAYLISPDKRYLIDLDNAQQAFLGSLNRLFASVADNPEQEQRLLEVSDLKGRYLKVLDELHAQREVGPLAADAISQARIHAQDVFNSLEGFVAAENRLRALRNASQRSEAQSVVALVLLLSAFTAVFVTYWGWHQIREASKQFGEALAKAEAASRAKDDFLGTVSHELRNPLNSIMLWSSTLLREQNLNERMLRGLTVIDRAVRAQANLIEDLLDISRIESGRLRLDVQAVDLVEVVRAGVEASRAAAESKSIALQEIIDPRVTPIAGDPARIQQVIWNLVSNAVKFTPKGGKVQVRVERINSHLEISVADSGQGIEPASLPFVFDRFWQAEEAVRSRHGVGLGLSIVKEIVGLHGGTVLAQSEGPGKGSTFTIRLPVPVSTVAFTQLRRHPTVAPMASTASAPRLDGASILVVDDDEDARDSLKNLLGSLGAGVTGATSAQDALAILAELNPDVVVSDLGMPIHDGYFLAGELRRRERDARTGRRIPLVALTAYGRVEDKVKILAAGFDAHVVKPVDPMELAAILRSFIASHAL
jgi:signal transduction histidine kinase/CheY-like chemotaxis protein